MLHVDMKSKDMGNDTGCFWPKQKKSRIEHDHVDTGRWELLPTVILHEIYSMLPEKDRINASSTCTVWRDSLYHPKFWTNVTFQIDSGDLNKARYLISSVGRIVTHAVIKVNSLSMDCMNEFMLLLQQLNENDNLQSLTLEPMFSRMELPQKYLEFDKNDMPIARFIINICRRRPLQKFSLGMNEDLLLHTTQYLQLLADNRPERVTTLGLATVKDDPTKYFILSFDPDLLTPFRNIQILSIDYDAVSDMFLQTLGTARKLERLVIHVHGIWEEHRGTTEEAWQEFSEAHPNCDVRLSLIHAYDEVMHSDLPFLKRNMRLTHFRALFCENINTNLLDVLSRYYANSLRSFMWVDSLNNKHISWNLIDQNRRTYSTDPDPLVILAWLCYKLEEITFIGYKYPEEDLVAIARLRRNSLKKLEVANNDVVYSRVRYVNAKQEIPKILGEYWEPIRNSHLHPVILNPIAGDSDEFISPYLLSDLR